MIEKNMAKLLERCNQTPSCMPGPLTTTVAPAYDHITSGIGADDRLSCAILCYAAPKAHVGLPKKKNVTDGVIANKIATPATDFAKGHPGAHYPETALSKARFEFRHDE